MILAELPKSKNCGCFFKKHNCHEYVQFVDMYRGFFFADSSQWQKLDWWQEERNAKKARRDITSPLVVAVAFDGLGLVHLLLFLNVLTPNVLSISVGYG